jgi:hypothetical protein
MDAPRNYQKEADKRRASYAYEKPIQTLNLDRGPWNRGPVRIGIREARFLTEHLEPRL